MIKYRTRAAIFGIVMLALLAGSRHARAQQPFTPPDALIIVQPTGDRAAITISYAGKVAHPAAKEALAKLAKLGGWSLSGIDVSDVDMKTQSGPDFGPFASLGVQTGASGSISGAPLASQGGFLLQPFVEAFRGLKSYKLIYWVAPQNGFQGLRSFDSPEVSIDLIQEGGPYRYSIVNHTHQGPVPRIPLTQARVAAGPAQGTPTPARSSSPWAAVGPVLAISVGTGLAVFLALRLYTRARTQSRNRALRSRTTSRDPHHTSRV